MGSDPMETLWEKKREGKMSDQMQDRIDYMVVCVNDFADAHGMSYVQGYDYLKHHSGLPIWLKSAAGMEVWKYDHALSWYESGV